MHYPLVISRRSDSSYRASSPDLPNCLSTGRSMYEAIEQARESIRAELEKFDRVGRDRPIPSAIDSLRERQEYAKALTFIAVSL